MSTLTMPAKPKLRLPNSFLVWLAVVAGLGLAKWLLGFFPNAFADPQQAAFFTWPALIFISGLGFVGVWLAERTGFPDPLAIQVLAWRRFLLPLTVGVIFGGGYVLLDRATGFSQLIAAHHGVQQQYTGFLPMLLIFAVAAVIQTLIFRILPLSLLLWLIANWLLRGRGQAKTFWLLAILLSALEPLAQTSDLAILPLSVMAADALFYYAVCLTEASFFRQYGFLAAILARFGFYFVWHVLYVH